jgi:hypothetical protein
LSGGDVGFALRSRQAEVLALTFCPVGTDIAVSVEMAVTRTNQVREYRHQGSGYPVPSAILANRTEVDLPAQSRMKAWMGGYCRMKENLVGQMTVNLNVWNRSAAPLAA